MRDLPADVARCVALVPDAWCMNCRRRWDTSMPLPVGEQWYVMISNSDSQASGCMYWPIDPTKESKDESANDPS